MLSVNTAHTITPPPVAPTSSPNLLIDPLYTCGGPAGSGANVQATDFCDPMMKLMPAEISQVSTPARTRWAAAGSADATASASAAAPTARRNIWTLLCSMHKPNRGCASPIDFTQDRARHVKLPQKRWMRRQASSTSSVLVVWEPRKEGTKPNGVPCT